MQLSEIRKTVINVLTVVVTAGPWILKGLDFLPGSSGTVLATAVSAILGLAGMALHYLVPNTTDDPVKAENGSMVYRPDVVAKKAARRKSVAKPGAHPHKDDVAPAAGKHEAPEKGKPVE